MTWLRSFPALLRLDPQRPDQAAQALFHSFL
jgi:hypothetical protein